MPPELLDRPAITTPLEGQSLPLTSATRIPLPADVASGHNASPMRRGMYSDTWRQGALVGLVSVSLLIVMTLGVITIFSALSATLLTIDAVMVVGLASPSVALFALLARSQRPQR